MRPPVDLHIHSTFSDGTRTVDEICALAEKRGMRVIALSDHDTADGLVPMADALNASAYPQRSIQLIPAIEMSSGDSGLTHVLGYGVRTDSEPLESELAALRRKRVERTRETVRILNTLTGIEFPPEFLSQADEQDASIGRMHVARMLIEKQLVRSIDEAFGKYLAEGRPAFIPLRHNSWEKAIDILRKSRAVPVLAHPMRSGFRGDELERYIVRMKAVGLMGVEVFHPSASHSDTKWLYKLARRLDLLVTGGSDFHGDWSLRNKIGEYPSGWHTWQQDIDTLQAAINESNAR
ncbi:MAG: PHP domain-containing protein [Clostridiales bacterium]|nr:PHP domain-containing protein [Clostridiales bacterium]